MKRNSKLAAVAVSAAMLAACSATDTTETTELNGTDLTDTTQADTEIAGMVVMDAQSLNDLIAEFDGLRTEVQAAASPAVMDAWNALEIHMTNLVVSADAGGVPEDVVDETMDAVEDVTAALEAEGDAVEASLSAAWNAFVSRFAALTS